MINWHIILLWKYCEIMLSWRITQNLLTIYKAIYYLLTFKFIHNFQLLRLSHKTKSFTITTRRKKRLCMNFFFFFERSYKNDNLRYSNGYTRLSVDVFHKRSKNKKWLIEEWGLWESDGPTFPLLVGLWSCLLPTKI